MRQEIQPLQQQIAQNGEVLSEVRSTVEALAGWRMKVNTELWRLHRKFDNLRYELCTPEEGRAKGYFLPHFRSNEETLRLIMQEKKSLARFGDGEFALADNNPHQKFQRKDERLAERIKQVLCSQDDRLLIAIANNYGNLDQYNDDMADGIRYYMNEDVRKQHAALLDNNRVYSDTYITRPYALYRDNMTEAPRKRFEALKQIWKNKRIVMVEGSQTRLGAGNDLFAEAADIRRILAPPTSSFDRYDDILKEALRVENADLFILAIGPSSGILAYDLTQHGIQAIDVGHLDIEYEWFRAGKGKRVLVPGKYVNEVWGGDKVADIHDEMYTAQIIADLSARY